MISKLRVCVSLCELAGVDLSVCSDIDIVGVCISVWTWGCGSQCDNVRLHAVISKLWCISV